MTCAPFFAGGVGLFGIDVKFQREIVAHPYHHLIEGQLALAVAAHAHLLAVGHVQLASVLWREVDMAPGADHLGAQLHVAGGADEQGAAGIFQLA